MSDLALERFQVLEVPLPGIHAVEASAGTGKTWNITALYLRLLLETDLTPERILVVTYTVAATAELRTRIRKSVQEALDAFRLGRSGDPLLAALLERFPDHERAARRLGNAVRTFDEAAIFTIHGFCQRVLGENAFETGVPLQIEMLTDPSELLAECVEDFWRSETYLGSPLWTRYLVERDLNPEKLRGEIASLIGRPFEAVFRPEAPPDTAELEARYDAAFSEARVLWAAERDEILSLLRAPGLSRNKYREKSVADWRHLMDQTLAGHTPSVGLFERFFRFTPEGLADGTNKGKETPRHAFFDVCGVILRLQGELGPAYEARLGILRARLLDWCNQEIRRRKEERRFRWFDDLLIDLEKALTSANGAALGSALCERFGAALIDEFQDTDPLQYSIFRRIYGETEAPVFLVGDPKQAIYAFRGADVYAYLQARAEARDRFGLDENHRSDRGVVEGVNAVFQSHPDPFVIADIPFTAVRAAHPDRAAAFREATGLAPVRAWFLAREDDQTEIPTAEGARTIAEATADEIARLLASGAMLPGPNGRDVPVQGGHVAVLVRTHPQGQMIRRALSARGIAAVEESQESVFETPEADEVTRLLAAIAEPDDERLVRGALATTLLGATADRLVQLAESEHAWEAELASFHDYRRLWLADGFGRMFRRLLFERDIPRRLLEGVDGERRLTNVLQVGELLTHEATVGHDGFEKLLQWLAHRRRSAANSGIPPPEHLLRLESDDALVQITTLHAAKGLEYPIVFVPFAWFGGPGRSAKAPYVTFHQPESGSGKPFVDFGSPRQGEFQHRAAWEILAEDLRLLYVALTRAKHHCTFGWGAVRGPQFSALAWLLHSEQRRGGEGDTPLAIPVKQLSDADLWAALDRVAESSHGAFVPQVVARSTADGARPAAPLPSAASTALAARTIDRDVRNRWRITSFSALRGGRSVDHADRDGRTDALPAPDVEPAIDVFGFPRGTRPGVCLHKLFELHDFADPEPASLRGLVEHTLDEYGFSPVWVPPIQRMVRDVLDTPLDEERTVLLRDVPRSRRLDEVEFHYPAGRLSLDGLNELLRSHGYPGVPDRIDDDQLPRPLVDGYVKGYIDLVFEAGGRYYLADYKSNWLGSRIEAYRPEVLDEVVRRELYTLQYVTYTVALHRFLRIRVADYDYDRHVGGAYYLFLRGMRPERGPSTGVFFDRPPRALVEELDARIGRVRASGAGSPG